MYLYYNSKKQYLYFFKPAVATQKENRKISSYRFRPRITKNINHYSELYKRKKTSIVEEALEEYFDRAKQKEEEILEFRRLIQEGRDSGFSEGIPTLEEIKELAKKRHPHNYS